jgi:PIN domain nuclease of toxin-antitoxin system
MKFLADTHLLLWLAEDNPRLSSRAKSLLLDATHEVYFSSASIWEISIKYPLGRSEIDIPAGELHAGMKRYGFLELPVTSEHALAVADLPSTHGDPFDRILVAQAKVEDMQLLTADRTLSTYPGVLRV